MATAEEIAQSMISEIRENGDRPTYQSSVVQRIREEFGEEWSYLNDNGRWAIDPKVLRSFRKLKDETVVWDRWDQSWRIDTAG